MNMHLLMLLLFFSKISYLSIPSLINLELENVIKCGEFRDVLNEDQHAIKVSAVSFTECITWIK
jgi:hypothetical protein